MKHAFGFAFASLVLVTLAQAADTQKSLDLLKARLIKHGIPKIEGTGLVTDKTVPVLYFGTRRINNNFDAVDGVKKSLGGTATIFVKSGDDFVRISTNVLKDDGTRALGTTLAKNKAYETVVKGQTFCGSVDILGQPYDTCYEPIKDAGGSVIGIYYVGYKK